MAFYGVSVHSPGINNGAPLFCKKTFLKALILFVHGLSIPFRDSNRVDGNRVVEAQTLGLFFTFPAHGLEEQNF